MPPRRERLPEAAKTISLPNTLIATFWLRDMASQIEHEKNAGKDVSAAKLGCKTTLAPERTGSRSPTRNHLELYLSPRQIERVLQDALSLGIALDSVKAAYLPRRVRTGSLHEASIYDVVWVT